MPRRSRTMARSQSAGKKRSSRHSRNRVGTSGHAASGHGSSNNVIVWSRGGSMEASTSGGTSWVNSVSSESSGSPSAATASSLAGVGPPLPARLARSRHHRRHQHQLGDGHLGADQRRDQSGQGLRHQHEVVTTVADGVDHRGRVRAEPDRLVARQIHGDHVVAEPLQLSRNEVPGRGAAAGAMDADKCRHAGSTSAPARTHRQWPVNRGGRLAAKAACPSR